MIYRYFFNNQSEFLSEFPYKNSGFIYEFPNSFRLTALLAHVTQTNKHLYCVFMQISLKSAIRSQKFNSIPFRFLRNILKTIFAIAFEHVLIAVKRLGPHK